ncbi:MAG: hypothetical protein RLZZ31_811 [Actinomycetota bacterium]|jgi:uncharacterized membrane protein
MSEQASEQIHINATVEQCFATLTDFASYPQWAGDLKEVTVIESDDHGRATVVEFRAAAMGRSTTYQLKYDYSDAPHRLSWGLVEGDLERELDGAYVMTASGGGTDVAYELAIDLVYPIPGFVKRRAESRIIKTALGELKARVEGSPRPADDE